MRRRTLVVAVLSAGGVLVSAGGYGLVVAKSEGARTKDAVSSGGSGATPTPSQPFRGKRILHIDSYHAGYEWSDRLTAGITSTLKGTGVEYRDWKMDCKRHETDVDFQRQAALRAKAQIEAFRPDVVIVSDDNAFKYLVMPYYRDAALPIVFCGINWDASVYGAPYKNTTGMIEIAFIDQLIGYLRDYAKGTRIAYLSTETLTSRKNAEAFKKYVHVTFREQIHVRTFAEWKRCFLDLQGRCDMLLLENNAGLTGWDNSEARRFVEAQTRIPTGAINPWMKGYALIGVMEVPEEEGEWSAQAALKILGGTRPDQIPVVKSRKATLTLNLPLAEKLGIVFSPSLLRHAEIVDKEK